ncbi:MAG TPA: transporter [Xanthomonadaceae bacterium]|nr:transporter [Xanthomonadaceae bacterium]
MPIRSHCLSLAVLCALAGPAWAAEDAPAPPGADDRARLDAEVRRLTGVLEAQQRQITQLQERIGALELAERGRGLGAPAQDAAAPQVAQQPASAPAAPPIQVGEENRAQEDAQRREQEKALVVREHAPLFERRFTLDTGLSYSYYDRRQLSLSGFLALDAIFLGTINLDQSKATVATLDITGRYGLTDRINLEASLPYVWRDSRFVSGGAGGASTSVSEIGIRSSGVGDASVAVYYQLLKEAASRPDMVLSLRVRAPTGREPFGLKLIQPDGNNNNLNVPEALPTGTGLWSATANLSLLRTYDPVILFGNVGYTWYKPRDFDDISPVLDQVSPAEVALGNAIQASGGLAIALNDRSAISFGVSSTFAAATHTTAPGGDRQRVPGSSSTSSSLNIGATYALPSGWVFNGQLAAGLTPDAPNFVFSMRSSRAF